VRFALAVLLVCGFGGLAVYWPSTATKRCIGWLWRVAVISPWFCGMQFRQTDPDDERHDETD